MSSPKPRLTHDAYTVAWICPLVIEQTAATVMLDNEHELLSQSSNDHNVYTLGSINGHNVVIAGLPTTGNNPAAVAVTQMRNTFPQLRFGVLVGIGGGVPTRSEQGDIRLGHVVVSKPVDDHSGVVQYDHGKAEVGRFQRTGYLTPPPAVLLSAANKMDARRAIAPKDPVLDHLSRIDTNSPRLRKFKYPGADKDHLFKAEYVHPDPKASCRECGCYSNSIVRRRADYSDDEDEAFDQGEQLVIHRGTIAAGERVIKNGKLRDKLARQYNILCFEMEAAGALTDFPCLVIRGISDYSDSHKNDRWQRYAAAAAAAYARELFFHMAVEEVKKVKIAEHDVEQMIHHVGCLAQDNRYNKIRGWLNPPDPSVNLNKALKQRHTGTGSWFIQSQEFREWMSGTRRNLWLHGIPGCGKTVLSATIIEHLPQQLGPSHAVLYFFFDFNDVDKQSCDNLIRSLISQLYSRCENSREELDKLCSSFNGGRQQPTNESLCNTFLQLVNTEKPRIVLDALDECKTRKDLLSLMEQLAKSECSVLATSRREMDIESKLRRWLHEDSTVPIQQGTVNNDIRAYVHTQIQNDEDFGRWKNSPEVQDEIETELVNKANGMFRWATCQLDVLKKCLDLPQLHESLRSLPETLEGTYDRILANIDRIHRNHAIRILQFLTYSERPLTVKEMVDALAVDPDGDVPFSPKNKLRDPRDIMRICPSLVTLVARTQDDDTGDYDAEDDDTNELMIQLAHFSVQQYLMSTKVAETFPENMRKVGALFQNAVKQINAKADMTRVCLSYLSHLKEQCPVDKLVVQFPLAMYSARYWMDYAKSAETEEKVQQSVLNFLLEKREAYAVWGKLFDPEQEWNYFNPSRKTASPLYYISLLGLQRIAELLLERDANVNAQGGYHDTALVAASASGHKKTVQILLDRGAYNAQDGYYGTALVEASAGGHKETVQILLGTGANIAQGGYYDTALEEASTGGHKETVQILLDRRADVNAEIYGTALREASARGSQEIVQLLLDRGADVNAQGGKYDTALQAASLYKNNKEIIQLLLDRGADVNTQGIYYGTALQVASAHEENKENVQLLLDRGADVNAQGGEYGTALQAASARGYKETVQLLLDRGADVNVQGGKYDTALQAASAGGHKEIARMLQERQESNVHDQSVPRAGVQTPSGLNTGSARRKISDEADAPGTTHKKRRLL